MNTARLGLGGGGTQTAAIGFGGSVPPSTGATELYDGTSWVASVNMATARQDLAGFGTSSSALGAGGYSTALTAVTEEYNVATANISTS